MYGVVLPDCAVSFNMRPRRKEMGRGCMKHDTLKRCMEHDTLHTYET